MTYLVAMTDKNSHTDLHYNQNNFVDMTYLIAMTCKK